VEHALPNHPDHPWRTIAVVAAGVAALELLGLIIVAAALLAKPVARHVKAAAIEHASAAPSKPKAPAKPLPPRRAVSVTVLNGNGVAGAAATTASRVRARGYKIRIVGNAPRGGYGRSVVIYRAGRRAEAYRLSRDIGMRLISPLDGLRPRDFGGAQLAVIVGG